jgi:hypothetical protein
MEDDMDKRPFTWLILATSLGALGTPSPAAAAAEDRELDLHGLRPIDRGNRNYYDLRSDDHGVYVHAEYRPGDVATKQAFVLTDSDRRGRHRLTWRWRALVLPQGGNDCDPHKTDSAASVYVAWRRGLRWYGLKYSWSTTGPLGAVCDRRDNLIMRGETIVVRTGGPAGEWVSESIDVEAEFRKHFANGDPRADVPELIGFALLTDGDETHTAASADFGSFVVHHEP